MMESQRPGRLPVAPMATILNLTQHVAAAEQGGAGVVDLPADLRADLAALLTFCEPPSGADLVQRAFQVARLAGAWFDAAGIARGTAHRSAMIGGAPYFMPYLERAFYWRGIQPLYSFSQRESVEETLPDGSVVKRAVFRHVGWVQPSDPYEGYAS